MRTTLDIDTPILRELKKLQTREHKSLGQLVSELLVQALSQRHAPKPKPTLQWTSRSMGQPRVDVADKEALWSALDGSSR